MVYIQETADKSLFLRDHGDTGYHKDMDGTKGNSLSSLSCRAVCWKPVMFGSARKLPAGTWPTIVVAPPGAGT